MTIILRRPWKRQPQYDPQVNRANSLARGLVFSLNPPSGEIVGKATPSYFGAASRGARANGLAFVSTSTANDAVGLNGSAGLYSITDAFTVSLWLEPISITAYTNFLSVPYRASGWTTPYNSLVVYEAAGGVTAIQWATSSTNEQHLFFSSRVITNGAGTYANYVITRSGQTCSIYKNGLLVQSGTATGNSNIDWGEKRPVTLLNCSTTSLPNAGYTGFMDGCEVWNRALGAIEIAEYYRNRYVMLNPQRIIIPVSVAAGTAPTLSALSAINVTATSAQPRITYTF